MTTEPALDRAGAAAAGALLSARAVRARAHQVLETGLSGRLAHFAVDPGRLGACAAFVLDVTRESYPDLDVPFHARWRHFAAGGVDRWAGLKARAGWSDPAAMARAAFDLAMVSVLTDAGAGAAWAYREAETGRHYERSEGLAVACLRMIEAGAFSDRPDEPIRVDAGRLSRLGEGDLAAGFQASQANPLIGLEGRARLLRALGEAVAERPDLFARADDPRPGGLFDHLAAQAEGGALPAEAILEALLEALGPIWPGRLSLSGVALGDTWRHPAVRAGDASDGLIPFHKLSQWLAYSLIEPLQWAGIRVVDIDGLTGLAEYRNGGLFLDTGVIALKDPAAAGRPHDPGSELVVEWRALTVGLLDRLAERMRADLGLDAHAMPLAKVLEGGSWAAGRRAAKARRPGGEPPLTIASDGTVF